MSSNSQAEAPHTPPKNVHSRSVVGDTPRSARGSGRLQNLPHIRRAIAEEMRYEMVVCTVDEFERHYMPFQPTEGDIESCIKELTRKNFIETKDGQPCWQDDHFSERLENVRFKALVPICKALQSITILGRNNPTYTLVNKPTRSARASISGGSHIMDGCFYPVDRADHDHDMQEIAVTAEYKRKDPDKDVLDDRLKIISNASFAMNESPRRMFMFGLTIEDFTATLWYFSRSHSTKSESFDWKRDPRRLIAAFVVFMFSSSEELGFDPTIRRYESTEGPEFFVYQVQSRYFKTLASIAEYHPNCITGRGTRVWSVVEVHSFENITPVSNARKFVLKDVWLDRDAATERTIQNSIFKDVEDFCQHLKYDGSSQLPDTFQTLTKEIRETVCGFLKDGGYKKLFLSIVCDATGASSKALSPTARPDCNLFEVRPTSLVPARTRSADPSRSQHHPSRTTPMTQPITATPRAFLPKRQYRVVFSEACHAVDKVKNFNACMRAIRDGVYALIIMYLAGWVHRDISGGNILWYVDQTGCGRGILSDLEYAKKPALEGGSADPKTGTPFFMAYEILRGKSLAGTGPAVQPVSDPALPPQESQVVPVKHNFLHDMESVWWLHLWTMLDRVCNEKSQQLARQIFVHGYLSPRREEVFTLPGELSEALNSCLDARLLTLKNPCENMRYLLYWSFCTNDSSNLSLYGNGYRFLLHLLDCSIALEHDITTHSHCLEAPEDTEISNKQDASDHEIQSVRDDELVSDVPGISSLDVSSTTSTGNQTSQDASSADPGQNRRPRKIRRLAL